MKQKPRVKYDTVLIIGPSGGGKDTQANLVHEKYGFEHIGTGNMFRILEEEGNQHAIEATKLINAGRFVDSESVFELLDDWVERYDNTKPWAFVSAVRLPDQISLFDEFLKKHDRSLDLVILLHIDEESAKERMRSRLICSQCSLTYSLEQLKDEKLVCPDDGTALERRVDDITEQAMTNRFEEYYAAMRPIITTYQARGILKQVDGRATINEVAESISQLLIDV